jgi:low temperature requirement protein LtrA
MHVRSVDGEERVTPLELFFDLVFVFAITQVTGFLAANGTGEGLLDGGGAFRRPISWSDTG